jgi:hypothetical protein
LVILKLDIVLLETVKDHFVLVVNENFEGILHELSANIFNFRWKGS